VKKKIPAAGLIGEQALREAATEFGQITELVRGALADQFQRQAISSGAPSTDAAAYFGIDAIYPDRVIACYDGHHYSFPYTIGADNKVALGNGVEVIEGFTPVAGAAAPLIESLDAGAVFLEAADPDGKVWDAVLIRSGLARNSDKTFYPDATLREAAPLFDGVSVFAKPDIEHRRGDGGKDVNKLVGWISTPRFVDGKSLDTGYLAGRVNFAAGAASLRETITDAWKRGKRDLVGLSIDALGRGKAVTQNLRDGAKRIVTAITKVNSVDLIVEPSAGGALVRLVEAADEEDDDMKLRESMLEKIKTHKTIWARIPDPAKITDEDLELRYAEAVAEDAAASAAAAARQPAGVTVEQLGEVIRMTEARAYMRATIAASALPQKAKEKVAAQFTSREKYLEADVDAAITAEGEYVATFRESGHVVLPFDRIEVEDKAKRIDAMWDAFFDKKHKNHADVQSFRECYVEVTGDRRVTGRIEHCDLSRMSESLGVLREALDSTSFANVLGNSITRRMIADYRDMGQYDVWRNACETVPVTDFRTNERTRFGGYGDLPIVAENDPYQALSSPTDEKATYAIAKRGGTESVTLEMIANDDVGAIRRIPSKLSRSAKRTLAKFVLDFVRTNPTIYDAVAFFHASHGNLGSAALAAAEVSVARTAMLKQTELNSADRIGIGPKYLWVPSDLQDTAWTIFQRNTNLDKTFTQQLNLEIMPVWYWTDVTDWALSADNNDIPGIEIGFLNGNQEPELFVQDMPNVGSMFTNDQITYKIRHPYGGNVKEFRGWFKAVVAG
jgi:hypothetical protein